MSIVSTRRFLVRDDGTGHARDEEVAIDEFSQAPAIVVLGDPGLGKTTLLRELGGTSYATVRTFLAAPRLGPGGIVFLDALDEYRNAAPGSDSTLDISRALSALGSPKFRLSCRAADWYGSIDQEVISVASANGQVVVLELLPLNEAEIQTVLDGKIADPASFLRDAEALGLASLLSNPQTLELIAGAWKGNRRPRNKFEAYEFGTGELLLEANAAHVGPSPPPMIDTLTAAASASASVLLLSNRDGLSRVNVSTRSNYAPLSDVPSVAAPSLDAVLRRRIFRNAGDGQFEFIHRTVQEFLAAKDLSQRISSGLPVQRVLAMMCGSDGAPFSSSRGLFGWLMCMLGDRAIPYVSRDPYAIVTYGDPSALTPSVQRALWSGLRTQGDPWFLTSRNSGTSFHHLANKNTAAVLGEILNDSASSLHLRVAVLEALAGADQDLGFTSMTRDIALNDAEDVWIRTAAVRATVKFTDANPAAIARMDAELSARTTDAGAPYIRLELLRITLHTENVADRTVSILKQFVVNPASRRTFGGVYRLLDEFPIESTDAVLGRADEILIDEHSPNFEVEGFLRKLLTRQLYSQEALNLNIVGKCLSALASRGEQDKDLTTALQARLQRQPSLFSELFDVLVAQEPNDSSFSWFLAYSLWRAVPAATWPIQPALFFLDRAIAETVTEKARDLFFAYVAWFPQEASPTLAERAFELIASRVDLRRALGKWNVCKIEKWRLQNRRHRIKQDQKRIAARESRIRGLQPRLTQIAAGADVQALLWGTAVYLGFFNDVYGDSPRERFKDAASVEIEKAFTQGAIQYLERQDIPSPQEVQSRWEANSIPWSHVLIALSVFLRELRGIDVPVSSIPSCVAAVVTTASGHNVPEFEKTLEDWFVGQVRINWSSVKPVLTKLWLSDRNLLPGLHLLLRDKSLDATLADLAAEVLRNCAGNLIVSRSLVPELLNRDRASTWTLSQGKLADPCLTSPEKALWLAAAYLLDPVAMEDSWMTLELDSDEALWEAIEVWESRVKYLGRSAVSARQLGSAISLFGKRFTSVPHPVNGWAGTRNPWDGTTFVSRLIEMLSADTTDDGSVWMTKLEQESSLASYHALIRHQRSQQDRARRDAAYVAFDPAQVKQALMNLSPANPSDLLACVSDHLNSLSLELTHTQRERFRAYWNEKGRALLSPKREEVCSGLLAEDLQHRVRSQSLRVTVEHHMVEDKECDLVVLQGTDRLLPIEVKHHFHAELWTAWNSQLQKLYTRDVASGGLGIYLVLWSGTSTSRRVPKPPSGISKPSGPDELRASLQSRIPTKDQSKLVVIVVDISPPFTPKKLASSAKRRKEHGVARRMLEQTRRGQRNAAHTAPPAGIPVLNRKAEKRMQIRRQSRDVARSKERHASRNQRTP